MSDESSVVELRERLARLGFVVAEQAAAVERLEAENAELRRRLGQNPRNWDRAVSGCLRTLAGAQQFCAIRSYLATAAKHGLNWLGYAVEQALLDYNPLDRIQWTAPEPAEAVDRRVVANPTQVAGTLATLASLGGHANRLVAYFGCLYHAGTRPSEAADLRLPDCELPGRCTNCDTAFDDLLAVIPALNCPTRRFNPVGGESAFQRPTPTSVPGGLMTGHPGSVAA